MRVDKIKGTLVDFNELEHLLDDCAHVGAWQIELRKRNDDPLELDELVLHVAKHNGISETQLARELSERFATRAEVHPNRIIFHSPEGMRVLQGIGSELKERKLVDHRPSAVSGADVPPAIQPAGVSPAVDSPAADPAAPPGVLENAA
jgi:hypothetical protein